MTYSRLNADNRYAISRSAAKRFQLMSDLLFITATVY